MITNAKDRPLGANTGGLPDMGDALFNYLQPMTFTRIVKTIVNYEVVETPTDFDTQGVWQPFSPQMLMMKPEGQRKWSWFMLHVLPGLNLEDDEVVTYLGVQYRVKSKLEYQLYGYQQYELVDDYTGSGPG